MENKDIILLAVVVPLLALGVAAIAVWGWVEVLIIVWGAYGK